MSKIVHLVRHGEVYNPDKILYGRLPGWRLSDRGEEMARVTGASFAGHSVTHIVASPLLRAQQTATPLSESTGLPIHTDNRIIEAGNDFEGLHIRGIDSALWNPKYWPKLINPTKPSWGEPYQDIADRMWDAIDDARNVIQDGAEAVLVSHQLPIVTIQRETQGKPYVHNPALRECNLASVTSLIFEGNDLVNVVYTEPSQDV